MRFKTQEDEQLFIAEKFGIKLEDALYYHSGICYARAAVKTPEAAKIISEKVYGGYVNGGMLDGMPLGRISKFQDSGEIWYEVIC